MYWQCMKWRKRHKSRHLSVVVYFDLHREELSNHCIPVLVAIDCLMQKGLVAHNKVSSWAFISRTTIFFLLLNKIHYSCAWETFLPLPRFGGYSRSSNFLLPFFCSLLMYWYHLFPSKTSSKALCVFSQRYWIFLPSWIARNFLPSFMFSCGLLFA